MNKDFICSQCKEEIKWIFAVRNPDEKAFNSYRIHCLKNGDIICEKCKNIYYYGQMTMIWRGLYDIVKEFEEVRKYIYDNNKYKDEILGLMDNTKKILDIIGDDIDIWGIKKRDEEYEKKKRLKDKRKKWLSQMDKDNRK